MSEVFHNWCLTHDVVSAKFKIMSYLIGQFNLLTILFLWLVALVLIVGNWRQGGLLREDLRRKI